MANSKPNEGTAEGQQTAPNCCKICGDSAGCGVNFGCLSCESCKAFFRRCSVRSPPPKCPFSGLCRITKASRRACQACRWAKCVRNGMRKELVDVWKKVRKKTEMANGKGNGTFNGTSERRKERGKGHKAGRKGTGSCCGCKCGTERQTEEKGTQTEDELAKGAQQILLNELVRANGVLDAPLRLPNQQMLPFNLSLVDALRVCEWAMRRMVAMCKQLGAFRALPQSDQITLLRAGLVQLLILRGAMAFDPVNEVWRHAVLIGGGSTGPLPFMLNLNVLPATERHYQEHKRFLLTFGEQWRTDRTVMLTLQAIVLFSPQSNPLEAREEIRMHRRKYCELLKSHLDGMTKSAQGTESAFSHLMTKLEELVKLNNSFQLIYLQLNQSELEPLFREILASK